MTISGRVASNRIIRRHMEHLEGLAPNTRHTQSGLGSLSSAFDMRILLFDDGAMVLVDTNSLTQGGPGLRAGETLIIPEVLSALSGQETIDVRRETQTMYFAMPVAYADGERLGAMLLVASVEDIFESIAEIRSTILGYSLLVGLAVIVLIFFTSNQLIAPVRRMLRVVQKMETGQLNQRVPVRGGNEYAMWGKAFNAMSEKLEKVEQTREEFVSNVSHELKTPLSSMKVLSEAILLEESLPEDVYREFLHDVVSEVDRMTQINNDLLALVKIDQREQGLNIQLTSINKMVEDILKRLSPLAD